MNKIIVYILCAGMAAVGCKKSSGGKEEPKPKEEVIQLEQIDMGNVYHKFSYNSNGLLTRVESHRRPAYGAAGLDTMYQYSTFEYDNGILRSAAYHDQVDPSTTLYYTAKTFKYVYNNSKQLSYVAGIVSDRNGIALWKDTTYYYFDNRNRMTSMHYRNSERAFFKDLKWVYDAAGNVQRPDSTQPGDNRTTTYFSCENRYDNHINPWRFKNLSLAMFTVYEEDIFEIEHKFSYNNPIYSKDTRILERKNSRDEVVESTGENRISELVIKLDKNNSPESADSFSYLETLENRVVVGRGGGFSHSYKMSSQKKTI